LRKSTTTSVSFEKRHPGPRYLKILFDDAPICSVLASFFHLTTNRKRWNNPAPEATDEVVYILGMHREPVKHVGTSAPGNFHDELGQTISEHTAEGCYAAKLKAIEKESCNEDMLKPCAVRSNLLEPPSIEKEQHLDCTD
jgi:hypothetical protein